MRRPPRPPTHAFSPRRRHRARRRVIFRDGTHIRRADAFFSAATPTFSAPTSFSPRRHEHPARRHVLFRGSTNIGSADAFFFVATPTPGPPTDHLRARSGAD